LVVFNDNALDQWRQSGGANNVQLPALRRHNLSDGVAIFRPHSAAVPILDYNTSGAELRTADGTVKITLTPSGITFTGNVTFNSPVTFNSSAAASALFTFSGSADFTGSIIGSTWTGHKHTGVTTGGGDTGGVLVA